MTVRQPIALIALLALSGTAWAQQPEPIKAPATDASPTTSTVNSATVTGSSNTTNSNNLIINGPVTIEAPLLPSPLHPVPPVVSPSSRRDAGDSRWIDLARGVAWGAAVGAALSGATYLWARSRQATFEDAREAYSRLPPDSPPATEQDAWQRMINPRDDTRQLMAVSVVGASLSLAAGIVAGTFWLVAPTASARIGLDQRGVRLVF